MMNGGFKHFLEDNKGSENVRKREKEKKRKKDDYEDICSPYQDDY